MTLFQDSKGNWYTRENHEATFNGKHNHTKARLLIFLYWRKRRGHNEGLCLGDIARETGCDYHYLMVKLANFSEWRYVKRSTSVVRGRPCFVYSIASRGIRFLDKRLPESLLNKIVAELQEYRKQKNLV